MHAGLLSDLKGSDVSIEIIQKDAKYECNYASDVSCSNNGLTSKTKKDKYGFKFVDSAQSCT